MSVIIETTLGDIVVDLYVEERPRCCLNFIKLCKIKYYNFCLFHSVQRNFVAQTGDPTGTGRSGESIFRMIYGDQAKFFDAERQPKLKHVKAGTISMVNDGNGFHGSQFLITLGENLDSLDGVQTVFGEVAEGMDVLLKINEAFCDGENRPYQDIRITHTVIIDDPLDDPPGLVIPDRSPDPTPEQIDGCFRIAADEEINPDEGADPDQIKKKEEKKEAAHRAQVLEIIGDIPDKDVKPPDNVLFVCKLNALTTDEDLEIIFSRFGTIVSCEIIRDYKTGDSLQYAFIEFESADMCEKAYYKMDNVLIDDRRIHVDFSQSVSKTKYPKIWRPENDKKKKADEKDTSKHPRLHQSHRNSSSPAHRDKSSRDREKAERWSRDDVEKMRRDSAPRRKKSSSSRHVDSVSEHSSSQKRIKKESHDNRKIQQMKNRHSVESSHSLSESGNHHAGNHRKASTRYESDSSAEPCEVRGGKHGKKCDVRDHDGVIRSRDVIHREERNSRRRVTSPPRRRHRHDVSDDTDSSSESGHVERKHRNDVVTSHSRKRDVGDRENGSAKKKKRKHKREKLSDNTKSRRADWTDMTSSDEAEVRCGKHRKRSVSSKRDVRRK